MGCSVSHSESGINCLRADGGIRFNGAKGHGQLVIGTESVLAFRTSNLMLMFGALGYAAGLLMGRLREPPPHMSDAELLDIGSPILDKLRHVSLLAKVDLADLAVVETRWGFEFTDGKVSIQYFGLPNKKKIQSVLSERGIDLEARS